MPEPIEVGYLKPFIDATIESSARFRRVLIVLIISSILVFSAIWNSKDDGWLNLRIKLVHKAENYFSKKEEFSKLNEQLKAANLDFEKADKEPITVNFSESQKNDLKNNIRLNVEKLAKDFQTLDKDLTTNYVDAEKWLKQREIYSKGQLAPIIEQLEKARIEYVNLIRVPFFGIVIDINDLGLLGGFTFVVILMWFRFSLWREYYNLTSTFSEAKPEHLEYCYKTLAMNQVLTVPPALSENQPKEKPWGKVVRILYFLPIIIYSIVFGYDLISFNLGRVVSEFNTILGTVISAVFLVLNIILTYWCYRLSSEIDDVWDKTAKKLKNP